MRLWRSFLILVEAVIQATSVQQHQPLRSDECGATFHTSPWSQGEDWDSYSWFIKVGDTTAFAILISWSIPATRLFRGAFTLTFSLTAATDVTVREDMPFMKFIQFSFYVIPSLSLSLQRIKSGTNLENNIGRKIPVNTFLPLNLFERKLLPYGVTIMQNEMEHSREEAKYPNAK